MVEIRTNANINEKKIRIQKTKLVRASFALPIIGLGMACPPGLLASAAVGGGLGLFFSNLTELLDLDKAERLSENKLAHEFFSACLTVSLTQMVKSCFPDLDLEKTKKTKVENREYERISKILSNSLLITGNSFSFNEEILKNKTKFEPFIILKANIPNILRSIQKDHQTSTDTLNSLFDKIFIEVFNTLYALEKFNPLHPYFNHAVTGPVANSNKERVAWEKHYKWIHKCLFEDYLFGQEETEITINDVYVPLRGVFEQEIVETRSSSDIKQVTREIHICDLQDALTEWLESLDNSSTAHDTIRLIGGSLGSGKSVFSKFFAHHVAKKNNWNMIYVDLQHLLHAEKPLQERLQLYLDGKTEAWEEKVDILSSIRKSDTPTLLIFDGLDELYAEGEQATELAVSLVKKLKNSLLHELNQSSLKAAAIVLGRTAAITSAKTSNDLPIHSSYSVMPLCSLFNDLLQLDKSKAENRSERIEIKDPKELRDTDQRNDYWKKWQALDPNLKKIKEDILNIDNLSNLTAEPLLFYLLIFSNHLQKSDDLSKISRNSLYKDLFVEIYDRDSKKRRGNRHPASLNLKNSADFLHLMECLALAVWQGGGSTGSKKQYEKYRDLHAFENNERFRKKSFAHIKNVALQFYVQNKSSDAKDFEFVHKSFGEYLSACAILRVSKCFLTDDSLTPEQFSIKWQNHFATSITTVEIHEFLAHETVLHFKGDLKKAITYKNKLVKILNWLLQHGFPSHQLGKSSYWHQMGNLQKNSWSAFLAILNTFAKLIQNAGSEEFLIRPEWPDKNSARQLIEQLDLTFDKSNSLRNTISYLDFAKQNLSYLDLSNLGLNYVRFVETSLMGTSFYAADLRNSNITLVNLKNVDLRSADLRNATIRRSGFWKTDLQQADLSGANLEKSDFIEANVSDTKMQGASLVSADLIASKNLSLFQIDSAFGDTATRLPKNLKRFRPKHWSRLMLDYGWSFDAWEKWQRKQKYNS